MMRVKITKLLYIIVTLFILEYFGVFVHFRERDYETEFDYPVVGDIQPYIDSFMKKGSSSNIINDHDSSYRIVRSVQCLNEDKSGYSKTRIVYVVKSAISNFENRAAIRETWGYEGRFADVPIKTVFLLGTTKDRIIMDKVQQEWDQYGDIVQGNFIDSYYNNTVKVMMGLRWATTQCPKSKFYLIMDDDVYVSTRNLLRFLRNPVNYPKYLQDDIVSFDEPPKRMVRGLKQHLVEFEMPEEVEFYGGCVFHTSPHRHKSSTWYVPLDVYPFDLWPPYVTGGAIVLSNVAIKKFYYASYFVKRLSFDDVYLGIVAKKLGIEPFNSQNFHFYKPKYDGDTWNLFRYVVSSHGFKDYQELVRVWNEQKVYGNA